MTFERLRLDEACLLITDGTHYTPKAQEHGRPFLTVKDMLKGTLDFDNCSRISEEDFQDAMRNGCCPQAGDVLFSKDGTVGKVHPFTSEEECAILSSIAIMRPNHEILDQGFFAHFLRSDSFLEKALRNKTGSAVRRIILANLRSLEIPLPPLEEQRRIAAILDKTDRLATLQARAALIEKKRLASICSEFLSDSGSLAWISVQDALKSQILLLHKDGNHGSSYPRAEDFGAEGVPFITAKSIDDDGAIIDSQVARLSEEKAQTLRIGWLEPGDVLLAHNASVGKTALYEGQYRQALIGTSLTAFRPNQNHLNPIYLFHFLSSPSFQRTLAADMSQTTRNQVPITAQRRLFLCIPPLRQQIKFAAKISSAERLYKKRRQSLQRIDALRQSLCSSLLSS